MIRTTTPLNHINMLSRQIHAPVALLLLLLMFQYEYILHLLCKSFVPLFDSSGAPFPNNG